MLRAIVSTTKITVFAAAFVIPALFLVPTGRGENSAMIFQSGPLGSGAIVKQRDGVTIIERRDPNGNSATVIQEK